MPVPARRAPDPLDKYPRPSVAADVAAFTIVRKLRQGSAGRPMLPEYELQVLLVQRGQPPFEGQWALPGGFVRPDETLDQAAARELAEEAKVGGFGLHHLANYSEPGRDPRRWVISSAYCALVKELPEPQGGSDAAAARLFHIDEANGLDLAFDHGRILGDAHHWVQERLLGSLVVREFLPDAFVLAELYGVLRAAVPGYADEPVNFRRKVLGRRIVEPTGETEARYSRRPARLFRFTGEDPSLSVF